MLKVYLADTETTTVDMKGDIIEISFFRFDDNEQKTWYLKAMNEDKIELEALRVNGHKLEDITWKTLEGRKKYRLPEEVLPEIENWIAEDEQSSLDRVLAGHNISFDDLRLRELWNRNGGEDTYPFGSHTIDTKSLAIFFDWAKGIDNKVYSLGQLVKRFSLLKRKAHAAENDVLMNVDLINYFKENTHINLRGKDEDK